MKAVNLLPSDLRSAGASGGSASGAGAYALIAALGLLLVVVATWAVSTRQVEDRRAEVTRLNAEAQAAEDEAGSLQAFQSYVTVADQRRDTVHQLAKGRVDWSKALREISVTLPDSVWITSMAATKAPGSGEGGANPLRGSSPSPAIELVGCTISHDAVALLIARLRSMDAVEGVRLASSEKSGGTGGSSAAGGGDCRAGGDTRPQFNIVVFFKAPAGAAPAAADGTAQTTSTGATK